jgi:hypothetical protein
VLARLRGGDTWCGVRIVGAAVVEKLYTVVGQHSRHVSVVAIFIAKAHSGRV